jgi:hypothetical protein
MDALSVLDLSPVTTGGSGASALRNSLDLARLADRFGYTRYWVAEHHNLPSVASSAPDIMIGQIAAVTEWIRVGSGGVMLPNHAPLNVAERFHMLEALFPGRIDLGIGRAPGTDPITSLALRRRQDIRDDDDFLGRHEELILFEQRGFPEGHPFRNVRAMHGSAPFAPEADALEETQEDEQNRRCDADLVVSGEEADQEGAKPHDDDSHRENDHRIELVDNIPRCAFWREEPEPILIGQQRQSDLRKGRNVGHHTHIAGYRKSFYAPGTHERQAGERKIDCKINMSGHQVLQSRATATVGDKGRTRPPDYCATDTALERGGPFWRFQRRIAF